MPTEASSLLLWINPLTNAVMTPAVNVKIVSFVLPARNEQESIVPLYRRIVEVMNTTDYEVEWVFVDDGSDDGSFAAMQALHEEDKRVKVIQFRRNFGKAAAYSAGFRHASGDIIVTMDTDLQDDPGEIPLFIAKIEQGFDLVVGWKHRGKGSFDKTFPSKVFNKVVALVTGIPLHDFNCPFKAYRRAVLEEIDIHGELHRYIPVLAWSKGFTLAEIKIKNLPRMYGTSKYGIERYLRGMLDLMTVVFVTRFAKRPLHLLGLGGVLTCLSGFSVLLVLTIGHVLYVAGIVLDSSWNIHDRPALSLGILLMIVGTQFFSMGLLGELIVNSVTNPDRETGYSIRRIVE